MNPMRKKIFMAAMLCLLLASTAELGFVNLAKANPMTSFLYYFNITPLTDKPIISLSSPTNGTVQQNETSIVFDVGMPQTWAWSYPGSPPGPASLGPFTLFLGQIKSVTFSLDQTQILSNDTLYGFEGFFIQRGPNYDVRNIRYTQDVGSLSLGQHSLTISVAAYTVYNYQSNSWHDVSISVTYTFMVGSPVIANLSIENTTYSIPDVPLVFSVNETTSWLGFSLDNQANVTANGNLTLTGLTEGNHSIVVYANDTFGKMGKSDTIFFAVSLPTPTPSPSPSPSPTIEPTLEPNPTPIPTSDDNQTLELTPILALSGIVVIAVAVGALVNFKRRR